MRSLFGVGAALALAALACGCPDDEPGGQAGVDTQVTADAGADVGGAAADAGGADAGDTGTAGPDAGDGGGTGCCIWDGDCATDERCVKGAVSPGFCVPKDPEYECYEDGDCGFGDEYACLDAQIPQCGPGASLIPGHCQVTCPGAPCCSIDKACGGLALCVQGNCIDPPTDGACYEDAQCGPNRVCSGAVIEPCETGSSGSVTLGTCVPSGEVPACCGDASPCPTGWTCGLAPGTTDNGTCKESATGGACWADADCPAGVKCNGAFVCPCTADCALPDSMGVCQGGPVGCCTTDFDCELGERCAGDGTPGGVCKPVPVWGSCWDGNDCSPTQTCEGASVCPCDADCDVPDTVGACVGGDSGCCTGAEVCPAGYQCMPLSGIGWSTCVATPEPGRCWADTDCPANHTCEGAAFCPCNADCDMDYEGTGVCTPPSGCMPIQTPWVKEWCDAASLVIWDGAKCVETCPGCCECKPFCDKTFPNVEACQTACGDTCVLWDGSCDDAIPENPWWARTAAGCIEVGSCTCDGCPGTFATKSACEASCP